MRQKLFYLRLAEKIFPGLQQKRFFTMVGKNEHYYSGLRMTEVQHIYKSYYDEFDFAFTIRCTFSICDKQDGSRWIRLPGDDHIFYIPPVVVVQRSEVSSTPAQIIDKMKKFYKANVLVCSGYRHPLFTDEALSQIMESNKLHLIDRKELPDDFQIQAPDIIPGKNESDRQKILRLTTGIKLRCARVAAY